MSIEWQFKINCQETYISKRNMDWSSLSSIPSGVSILPMGSSSIAKDQPLSFC